MKLTIGNIIKCGGLLTAAVVGITFSNPAMACTRPGGGGATAAGRPVNSRVLSMRNLGLLAPPKFGARDKAVPAKDEQAQADALNPTIVGLWAVMDTENGQPVDLSFELWHSDGTEVLIDQTPPPEGNVCIGTWQQTGALTYKLTHPALNFDMSGNYIGTVLINEVVTLDRSGLKFSGTYTVDVFDVNGQAVDHETGQFIGSKINPPV